MLNLFSFYRIWIALLIQQYHTANSLLTQNHFHERLCTFGDIGQKERRKIEDYLPIHDFMDATKELCSDNRHRILHTLWGVKRVIVPLFGYHFTNSDGNIVNVKDLCEQDHILPDYRNKFIPTLSDFVDALDASEEDLKRFSRFYEDYRDDKEVAELLISPLNNTGQVKSLLITHNSWFVNEIVPKIFKRNVQLKDFTISPSELFGRMNFELWMDNGYAFPKSAEKTKSVFLNK